MTERPRVVWHHGELILRYRLRARHVSMSGDGDITPLVDLHRIGLPEEMARAIDVLRQANEQDRDSERVVAAVASLQRYAAADHARRLGLRKGGMVTRLTDDRLLEAFRLATEIHEQSTDIQSLTEIRRKVAKRLGCHPKTLERIGVAPVPRPK